MYRDRGVSKYRFLRAYYTTFQVIFSYSYFSLKARWIGKGFRERNIGPIHQRNARRVYQTILALQGLFIKVGQLLSILANFLPEEFRLGARRPPGPSPAAAIPRNKVSRREGSREASHRALCEHR